MMQTWVLPFLARHNSFFGDSNSCSPKDFNFGASNKWVLKTTASRALLIPVSLRAACRALSFCRLAIFSASFLDCLKHHDQVLKPTALC